MVGGAPLRAQNASPKLIEEHVRIPADGYSLAATILRPAGPGPYGAVVLNHGVPGSSRERAEETSRYFRTAASEFALHGYVVVMPLRRGFGKTGGPFAEDAGPCSHPDYMKGETNASEDVMAAWRYTRALPYVDNTRMILAGQSAGGMVSLFTAAMRQPKGLIAVLSFAGGRGGNPWLNPGVPCAVEPVAEVLDVLGERIRVPVLMYYTKNDQSFGPKTSELWYHRFAAHGANVEYVLKPPFGTDGHYAFSADDGVQYWLPTVEKFLAANHVAFRELDTGTPATQLVAAHPPAEAEAAPPALQAKVEAPAYHALSAVAAGDSAQPGAR